MQCGKGRMKDGLDEELQSGSDRGGVTSHLHSRLSKSVSKSAWDGHDAAH